MILVAFDFLGLRYYFNKSIMFFEILLVVLDLDIILHFNAYFYILIISARSQQYC